MTKFWEVQAPQLVFWIAMGAILLAVLIYVVGKIRGQSAQQEPTTSELISKFRELHSKGVLSDAEFRTIKSRLAARLGDEVKDNSEIG
jgi:uncharacterized membrane protein